MTKKYKQISIICGLIIVISIIIGIYFINKKNTNDEFTIEIENDEDTTKIDTNEETNNIVEQTTEENEMIVVHVIGSVANTRNC